LHLNVTAGGLTYYSSRVTLIDALPELTLSTHLHPLQRESQTVL